MARLAEASVEATDRHYSGVEIVKCMRAQDPNEPNSRSDTSRKCSLPTNEQALIREFIQALAEEIEKVKGGSTITVHDGAFVRPEGPFFVYIFTTESPLVVVEDADAKIKVGEVECNGHIVSVQGCEVTVAMGRDFGNTIQKASLCVDRSALLEALRKRYEEVLIGQRPLDTRLAKDQGLSSDAAKLINVAITRPKAQLVIVANVNYLAHCLRPDSILLRVLEEFRRRGTVVDSQDILDDYSCTDFERWASLLDPHDNRINLNPDDSTSYTEHNFYAAFFADLRKAVREIIIVSPYLTVNRAQQFFNLFRSKVTEGIEVRVFTRATREHQGIMRAQAETVVEGKLKRIGVQVVQRQGPPELHEKFAFVDRQITWEGNLNPLSQSDGRSTEHMRRLSSPKTCQVLIELHKFGSDSEVSPARAVQWKLTGSARSAARRWFSSEGLKASLSPALITPSAGIVIRFAVETKSALMWCAPARTAFRAASRWSRCLAALAFIFDALTQIAKRHQTSLGRSEARELSFQRPAYRAASRSGRKSNFTKSFSRGTYYQSGFLMEHRHFVGAISALPRRICARMRGP